MDGQESIVTGVEAQESTISEPAIQETQPVNPTTDAETTENAAESAEKTAEATAEPKADGKTEEDSRFANVRRKAEADAKSRYEAEIHRQNDRIKAICAGKVNPETGKPIETLDDYFEALNAQERMARNEELRSKGIDPKMIEDMVNKSPVVQQANMVMQQSMEAEAKRRLEADVKAISEIDPTIKTEADLFNHPSYQRVYDYVAKNGLSLLDAYKLANADELSAKKTAAVKQAAINQAKGKNHLEATKTGVAANDNLADVPASTMAEYKKFYPGLTEDQIKVKYNELINNK